MGTKQSKRIRVLDLVQEMRSYVTNMRCDASDFKDTALSVYADDLMKFAAKLESAVER